MSEDRAATRAAVMAVLERIQHAAPGHAVELRIPPYAAVQVVDGPRHTRGTPAAVVEMDARTLLELDSGSLSWTEGLHAGRIHASGERSDLAHLFPGSPPRLQP